MSVEKAIQVGSIMSARVLRVWLLINVLRGYMTEINTSAFRGKNRDPVSQILLKD